MSQHPPNALQTENRFGNCVLIKLHYALIEPEKPEDVSIKDTWWELFKQLGNQKANTSALKPFLSSGIGPTTEGNRQISLKLTIRFHKETIHLPIGTIQFGLRRGELNLKLSNGKIPVEKIGLVANFELATEIENQLEKGQEAEVNIAAAGGIKGRSVGKQTIKTKSKAWQIANYGTEENPIWEFNMEPSLFGQLTEAPLGIIESNELACMIHATFSIQSQNDIELFDSSGLLKAKHISQNRTALATRAFFLRCIEPKLKPYMSKVEGFL